MSCDIHEYVEFLHEGAWISYFHRAEIVQNYVLFSVLANVRNSRERYIPVISLPKGLPNNLSEKVQESCNNWGSEGHSHSWLSLRELESYEWVRQDVERLRQIVAREEFGFDVGERCRKFRQGLMAEMRELCDTECGGDASKVRLVFWFDN